MHRIRLAATTIAVAALSIGAALTPAAHAEPAGPSRLASCQAAVQGDVNGDGFAEVAVGAAGENGSRGAVHLFSGYRGRIVTNATGTARDDLVITQDTAGVPGAGEPGDRFGATTTLADLNGDGCADLVVAASGEDKETGSITVLYGSPAGLSTTGAQQFTARSVFGSSVPAGANYFGLNLAAGDLDGDGITDLVTDWREDGDIFTPPVPRTVVVLYGSAKGVNRSRPATRLTAASLKLRDPWITRGLTVGDFDGDGDDEIAIGTGRSVRRNGDYEFDQGVQVVERRGGGFVAGASVLTSAAGFPGDHDTYVELGESLISGDVQGDGRDDLVLTDASYGMGEPESEFGKGAVVLLLGSKSGLTTAGSQFWTQASAGVEGAWRYGNYFGAGVAFGHIDRGPTADLVIGAPGGGFNGGSVTVLLGGSKGLTTAGIGGTQYTQSTPGIVGTDEDGDSFGFSVAVAQLAGNGPGSIVVGTPWEAVGKVGAAGAITQLGASNAGPVPTKSQTLTLDSKGIKGTPAKDALFGYGVS